MKTLIAASFTALLLAGAAAAHATPAAAPTTPGATTTETDSTPYAFNNRGSEALPAFNYQGAVPVTADIGPGPTNGVAPAHTNNVGLWNMDLVHQTGGSR